MRIAIVGAGLAGLASAAALHRSGHTVAVYEQADELRASGLAINMWSNATSLLPSLGIPAEKIPGEPFSRMLVRAGGRDVAAIDVPPRGLPHVNVDRAGILGALAGVLPSGAVSYGARRTDVRTLSEEHDLVVVADGTSSALRASVAGPPRRRWSWNVWQATVPIELPEVPPGTGSSVPRPGMFIGIWRTTGDRVTWFAEQPERRAGDGAALLAGLRGDPDPLVRALAEATAEERWIEWRTQDVWPSGTPYRGNVVLVGDAAHATLPTFGQGACQAIEDAAVLARAIAVEDTLGAALRRYAKIRVPRTRGIVALSRVGALGRRRNPVTRILPDSVTAKQMAASGGPVMRRLARPRTP
ncbi:MAG TPA: FAD-dependent monooxygenase [Streptosporangiaceae bacterium]|jgi:2-polyprenyl-6-methoxyphenol hydroxylase-like FAD-dependent oxidoreductase